MIEKYTREKQCLGAVKTQVARRDARKTDLRSAEKFMVVEKTPWVWKKTSLGKKAVWMWDNSWVLEKQFWNDGVYPTLVYCLKVLLRIHFQCFFGGFGSGNERE